MRWQADPASGRFLKTTPDAAPCACLYALPTPPRPALDERTDGLLGDLLPALDQGTTQLISDVWTADTLPPLNLLSSLENKWFGLLGDACRRGQSRPWSCCCCSPLQLSWRGFSASWYLLHNLGSVLGAFANHLATSVGSRYHHMLLLVVRAPNKSLNSGCLDDRLSFPPVVRPIYTPAGEIDSESLLLPKWTGWDPGSVTDDALPVFHPVLSRQRHTSARSRSSSASIFTPRIIPDAVENSHLSTRRQKTDAPVELSSTASAHRRRDHKSSSHPVNEKARKIWHRLETTF